jgi:hypothetical protein
MRMILGMFYFTKSIILVIKNSTNLIQRYIISIRVSFVTSKDSAIYSIIINDHLITEQPTNMKESLIFVKIIYISDNVPANITARGIIMNSSVCSMMKYYLKPSNMTD